MIESKVLDSEEVLHPCNTSSVYLPLTFSPLK